MFAFYNVTTFYKRAQTHVQMHICDRHGFMKTTGGGVEIKQRVINQLHHQYDQIKSAFSERETRRYKSL